MFEEELKNIYQNLEKIKNNRSDYIDDCKIKIIKNSKVLEDQNGIYISIFYLNSIFGLIKNVSKKIIKLRIMIGNILISQLKINPNEYVYPLNNISFIPNLSLKFMDIKIYIDNDDVNELIFYLLEYSVDFDNNLIKYLTDCGNIGSENYVTINNGKTSYLFQKGVIKIKETNMINNDIIKLNKTICVK
jgi:hypothetical protein